MPTKPRHVSYSYPAQNPYLHTIHTCRSDSPSHTSMDSVLCARYCAKCIPPSYAACWLVCPLGSASSVASCLYLPRCGQMLMLMWITLCQRVRLYYSLCSLLCSYVNSAAHQTLHLPSACAMAPEAGFNTLGVLFLHPACHIPAITSFQLRKNKSQLAHPCLVHPRPSKHIWLHAEYREPAAKRSFHSRFTSTYDRYPSPPAHNIHFHSSSRAPARPPATPPPLTVTHTSTHLSVTPAPFRSGWLVTRMRVALMVVGSGAEGPPGS